MHLALVLVVVVINFFTTGCCQEGTRVRTSSSVHGLERERERWLAQAHRLQRRSGLTLSPGTQPVHHAFGQHGTKSEISSVESESARQRIGRADRPSQSTAQTQTRVSREGVRAHVRLHGRDRSAGGNAKEGRSRSLHESSLPTTGMQLSDVLLAKGSLSEAYHSTRGDPGGGGIPTFDTPRIHHSDDTHKSVPGALLARSLLRADPYACHWHAPASRRMHKAQGRAHWVLPGFGEQCRATRVPVRCGEKASDADSLLHVILQSVL